ncbi:MAG: hypothetical protein JWM11_2401 [Planctomycetaceae bacterium]|nr:hypothetical protein [Planctomycetaceae bacterium]
MNWPAFTSLLFLFAWTSLVSGEELISTEALLKTAVESPRIEEQRDALLQLIKHRPDSRVVRAFALVLTRESSDTNVPLYAEVGINKQLQQEPNLLAPRELIAALKSTPEIRKRALEALADFRCYDVAHLPEVLEQVQKDDLVFVWLSRSFADPARLKRLTDHADTELRSIALNRIWTTTHDIDLCLPLYAKALHEQLPARIQNRCTAIEAEIKKLNAKVALLPEKHPELVAIEQQIEDLQNQPAILHKCRFNLSLLGRAIAAHKITTDHPEECGNVLAKIMADTRTETYIRIRAVAILTSIATTDNNDRERLVNLGILKLVEKCITVETDTDLISELRKCSTAMNTKHERVKTTKGVNEEEKKMSL